MNGISKAQTPKRFTHSRIVLSSSSEEDDGSDDNGGESSVAELNSSVDSRLSETTLSTNMSVSNGLPAKEKGDLLFTEHYAEEHKKRLLRWSSDDESDDGINTTSLRSSGRGSQVLNMSVDERQFYNTITSMRSVLSPRNTQARVKQQDDSMLSNTFDGSMMSAPSVSDTMDVPEKALDHADQAEYEERLRAALADVTLGQASLTRRPRNGSSRPRLKSEGRKRKPRRHIPKTENILNAKDWL